MPNNSNTDAEPHNGVDPLQIEPRQRAIDDRSVFVCNVAYNITEKKLKKHFGWCGRIDRVTVLSSTLAGRPKCFVYIEFGAREAANRALAMNGTQLGWRRIRVSIGATWIEADSERMLRIAVVVMCVCLPPFA